MYQYITFKSYLTKVLYIGALFVILPILFGEFAGSGTLSSYIASVICFFTLTVVSTKLLLNKTKYVKFYAFAYLLQIIIGLVHYLYFVDPNYFQTVGQPFSSFWHEYQSTFSAIENLQEARKNNGILYWMDAYEFQISHPEIYHFLTYPFYFLQHKWLNYSSLNVFSSLLTSMNILFLYCRSYEQNDAARKQVLYWSAFFPSFLLNGTLWRDPFGICLMSLGIVLVSLSNSVISKFISFLFFGISSFFQRTMYILIAGIASFWGYFKRTRNIFLRGIYVVVGVIVLLYLKGFTDEVNAEDYNAGYVNAMSYLALPIKIVFGMIGPFPWIQFAKSVEINVAFAWQLQDYLMGTFQFGYLIAIVIKWKKVSFKNLDVMTLLGFGIMLSGFISKQMHIGYISEGLLFTLPWFFSQLKDEYKRYFKYSFSILVALNVLILLMGNISLSGFWK